MAPGKMHLNLSKRTFSKIFLIAFSESRSHEMGEYRITRKERKIHNTGLQIRAKTCLIQAVYLSLPDGVYCKSSA